MRGCDGPVLGVGSSISPVLPFFGLPVTSVSANDLDGGGGKGRRAYKIISRATLALS